MTRLVDVGEYGLHAWLRRTLEAGAGGEGSVGDDCAFVDLMSDRWLLLTSDRLPLNLSGRYGGRLVVTQCFSDIISKGGSPLAFLLDVYLPRDATVDEFREIVLGAKEEAERYGARVVGGDTKEGRELTVVGVGIGTVAKSHRVTRAGARPGHVLALTLAGGQRLGARWGKVVADYFELPSGTSLRDQLEKAYARDFAIPVREMQAAVATGHVTAAIDNSDGLGGSLNILSRESGVGFVLDRERLCETLDPLVWPLAEALNTDPLRFALAPGYDWQCTLTTPADRFVEVRAAARGAGGDLVPIGEVTRRDAVELREEGRPIGRIHLFGDEKFKAHAWEEQPRHWIEFPLVEEKRNP